MWKQTQKRTYLDDTAKNLSNGVTVDGNIRGHWDFDSVKSRSSGVQRIHDLREEGGDNVLGHIADDGSCKKSLATDDEQRDERTY